MGLAALAGTARWIAAVRAQESRREDRLFHDPWAAALAGSEGEAWLAQVGDTPALQIIAIRARFFDEFLLRVTVDHGVRQVVLLAAGLDTRAFRLAWPEGTRVFEVDRAEVLSEKEAVLRAEGARPACERRLVSADLAAAFEDDLVNAGFHRGRPACWLIEGFLFYLAVDAVLSILDQVTTLSAPGSLLGFDIPNSTTLTHAWTRPWIEMQAKRGAPFLGTLDDPSQVLAARGWVARQVQAGDKDANFGRWPYPALPVEVPDIPRNWFVTAEKEQEG